MIGIAMTIGHSVWEPSWRGLVTATGCLSIGKCVARIGVTLRNEAASE